MLLTKAHTFLVDLLGAVGLKFCSVLLISGNLFSEFIRHTAKMSSKKASASSNGTASAHKASWHPLGNIAPAAVWCGGPLIRGPLPDRGQSPAGSSAHHCYCWNQV